MSNEQPSTEAVDPEIWERPLTDEKLATWIAGIEANTPVKDSNWYELCVLQALRELQRLRLAPEPGGSDAADAAKWRALSGCARITIMGSSGLHDSNALARPDAHVTLNFWTHNEGGDEQDKEGRRNLHNFVQKCLALTKAAQPAKVIESEPGVTVSSEWRGKELRWCINGDWIEDHALKCWHVNATGEYVGPVLLHKHVVAYAKRASLNGAEK